jgi:hypothetical protein
VKQKTFFDFSFFLEAWIYLNLARLLIIFFPFKQIAAFIGKSQVESSKELNSDKIIYDIELAIIRGIKYVIFSSKCYDQALATIFMLKRRKISSTIYFGLYKDDEKMLAHAWVRCGDKIVSGKLGYEKFTPVAWFASNN